MLCAVAKIFNEEGLYGYRILNTNTEEVKDCQIKNLTNAMLNKNVKIRNMAIKNGKPKLIDDSDMRYPRITKGDDTSRSEAIIVIGRVSLVEYRCTDYTGKVNINTLDNLTYTNNKVILVGGYIKDGEILMEDTYDIDVERVRYLEDKIKKYTNKVSALGDIPYEIRIIGHDAVIVKADVYVQNAIIPSFVTAVWEGAFIGCEDIQELTIMSNIKYIGYRAFYQCGGIGKLSMEDSDIILAEEAFKYCSYIEEAKLSNKLKRIPDNCFAMCGRLTDLDIPESVKSIGYRAFYFCDKLQTVKFNGNLDEIGNLAFEECHRLFDIQLPTVKSIGTGLFSTCYRLKDINLPTIDEIKESMFYSCWNLESIELPEGVKHIGKSAFSYCDSLNTVILPSTIKSIDPDAFSFLKKTVDVIVKNEVKFKDMENVNFIYSK